MVSPILELTNINKSFGHVHANKNINLTINKGTIHGIIGENGAGKSTLMSIVFGLYQAKQAQATESLIVVEGYMDVISLHQFGFHNAVATLGTAVTRSHVTKLLRYTKKIFFAFDGDQAGLKAAWKALINIFPILREDIDVRFIFFEQDKDPDTYLKEYGADGFKRLLTKSITISDYFFSKVKDFNLEKVEGRAQALSFAMPCIHSINPVSYTHLTLPTKRIV